MAVSESVFFWRMSAAAHKASVESLKKDILDAHANQTALPVGLVLDLLPLHTEQGKEVRARGDFEIEGVAFKNIAASDTWVEFEDPVLHTLATTLPAVFEGRLQIEGTDLKIEFLPALEVEIARLEELGVGRSRFQVVHSVLVTDSFSLTVLKEVDPPGRETWIEAQLVPSAAPYTDLNESVMNLSAVGNADTCVAEDPDDPNWYVYRRHRDGICIVHYGTFISGANAYQRRFGPAVKSAADDYMERNCNDAFC